MHDIHSSIVAAVPGILAVLRAKGYTFVPVTEPTGESGLTGGQSYARAPNPQRLPAPRAPRRPGEVRYP